MGPARWALLVASIAAIGAACSTYASDDEVAGGPGVDAGAPDGATSPPPPAPDAEADGDASPPRLAPPCPAPTVGSLDGKATELVAAPPQGEIEFPFQLAADARSVFWIAIPAPLASAGTSETIEAYNGRGPSRVRRVAKAGGAAETLVANQADATALALDGDHVYWGVQTSGASSSVRRARRDCAAPCTEEQFVDLPFPGVSRMLRVADGKLAVLDRAQTVFLLDVASRTVSKLAETPAFTVAAAAGEDLFVGATTSPTVQRATGASVEEAWAQVPKIEGFPEGPSALVGDCASVFASRQEGSVWQVASPDGGVFGRWLDSGVLDIVALAADARYVYLAAFNAGGVFAIDKATRAKRTLHTGNVWQVFADEDGVYWGEHARSAEAGKIYAVRR